MKRALKKREKAVLENTQSEEVPVEQQNAVNLRIHHRVPTKAAMIGLAISMGATSLLVTRQSDQALAAEPVGNQNTASTIPAVADAELKFAPTNILESEAVSLVSQPENPVLSEPAAISQVPGLGAKWQVAANGMSVKQAAVPIIPSKTQPANKQSIPAANTSIKTAKKRFETVKTLASTYGVVGSQTTLIAAQPQIGNADNQVNHEVNAQLKAQQEFALNRLQQKSNRLRASLAELRSEETKKISQVTTNTVQSVNVVEKLPTASTDSPLIQQSETVKDANKDSVVSRLNTNNVENLPTSLATPTAVTPTIIRPVVKPTAVAPVALTPSTKTNYEVKPGDTLAAIAKVHGTSISELVKTNNLTNPNQLQINQKLIIPAVEGSTTAIQAPVAVNSSAFELSSTINVGKTNANSVIASSIRVNEKSPEINNQIQTDIESTPTNSAASTTINSETVSSTDSSYSMGGDSPIPQAVVEMQLAQKPDASPKVSKSNQRLHSLQKEIERLRAKYRAQQSGNTEVVENTTIDDAGLEVPKSKATNNLVVPIPVARPSNIVAPTSVTRFNQMAVPIAVPRPRVSNYSSQPIKPSFRATRPINEPINPEFLPNQNNRVVPPFMDADGSQSFGVTRGTRRGTQVSPQLPPLAAVDTYLPKPIEEITPSSTGYMWPAKGVLTSGYGWRWGRMHKGIDIANGTGTAIYAVADGVVEKAGWNKGGYGNLVDIRHPDGTLTRYGHNSKVLVRAGQQVHKGQQISLMGSTGFSTGPHLHFEIHPAGKGAVNPIAFLPQERL